MNKSLPKASGTIRFFPESGLLDRAPVGSQIQSTYSRTTDENREFRRGYVEFSIPDFDGELVTAKLILPESRGSLAQPLSPDLHELAYYPADLEVNVDDFDGPTTLLDSFETASNLPPQMFEFDVTSQVKSFRGRGLGFRIKLEADPDFEDFGSLGSAFGELSTTAPWLEIQTMSSSFRRGDPNGDGQQDLGDAIGILRFLFGGGRVLDCEKSADVDDSGHLDIADPIYLLSSLFLGGPTPREPFVSCGTDATDDGLTCAASPTCP